MTDTLTKFGSSFQSKIIMSLLSNKEFIQTISDIIEPSIFDSDANKWLVKSIKDYFLQDLGMQAAVNNYLSSTDALLDDLFKFGRITESQLLALRKAQESAIIAYSNRLGSQIQLSMIQGVSNNMNIKEMK